MQAVSQLWAAASFLVWLAVPLVQVLVGVFPWRVNRWFGITATVYYGVLTPLLFQASASSPATRRLEISCSRTSPLSTAGPASRPPSTMAC